MQGVWAAGQAAARLCRGLCFVALWYGSICAGFLFIFCPLLPLALLHQKLYRTITDVVFSMWELYPTALMECVLGVRIVVTGDAVRAAEHGLLVMNHRTRTDWNFLWAAMFHASQPAAHRLKIVLKDPIRHIPGPGWVMQLTCFMFIHRCWEKDQQLLATVLDYLHDINHTCQVLLFPEGTDLTEGSRQRSHNYADSHGLPHYQYVLHPKTTGFTFLAQRMRYNGHLDAVYDMTVGYPCSVPQQETDLLKGNFPHEVHFHVKRYPISDLPTGDPELRQWLSRVWQNKENLLRDFYTRGGSFSRATTPVGTSPPGSGTAPVLPSPDYSGLESLDSSPSKSLSCTPAAPEHSNLKGPVLHSNALYLALAFWTLLSLLLVAALAFSSIVRWWALWNVLLFFTISTFSEGAHLLEIRFFHFKRRILGQSIQHRMKNGKTEVCKQN
ncbi:lysocardiolipin acyltransferase 1-like [Schistocerca nitens]|uniref:lysocardiolipin acyltransferase 1-like n=1 Tax=Schistocerca nitens TaxID=7011 RepID=UPI0021195CF3|nr:lysocardiolipin acyltransferase 1-like [Schistocerca nitens]